MVSVIIQLQGGASCKPSVKRTWRLLSPSIINTENLVIIQLELMEDKLLIIESSALFHQPVWLFASPSLLPYKSLIIIKVLGIWAHCLAILM